MRERVRARGAVGWVAHTSENRTLPGDAVEALDTRSAPCSSSWVDDACWTDVLAYSAHAGTIVSAERMQWLRL